jgi:hypothetical protein
MPTFARIATTAELPPIGAHETPSLDFKAQAATGAIEAAKDVAALASVYGGVLLIGACEDTTTGDLTHWRTMSLADAQQVVKHYEQAVRDRCVPVPLVDVIIIAHPAGDHVVAVNVQPVLDQVVAVRLRSDPADGKMIDTYAFPVRLSTHTIYLRPDQLPMLMNPEIRRVMILLESIPHASLAKVAFTWHAWTDQTHRVHMGASDLKIHGFDPLTNAMTVETDPAVGGLQMRVPLDDVETAWDTGNGRWCIRVSGAFDGSSGRLVYATRPKRA